MAMQKPHLSAAERGLSSQFIAHANTTMTSPLAKLSAWIIHETIRWPYWSVSCRTHSFRSLNWNCDTVLCHSSMILVRWSGKHHFFSFTFYDIPLVSWSRIIFFHAKHFLYTTSSDDITLDHEVESDKSFIHFYRVVRRCPEIILLFVLHSLLLHIPSYRTTILPTCASIWSFMYRKKGKHYK